MLSKPPIQDGWSDNIIDAPKKSWALWFANVWQTLQYSAAGSVPVFSATQNTQTLGAGVWTKLQFGTKEVDTISGFDNVTNFRYQPNVAGWYQMYGLMTTNVGGTSVATYLYKNGSPYRPGVPGTTVSTFTILGYFNGTTDYMEAYGIINAGGATTGQWFQGFLVSRT